ncbi:MAG: RNA-binding protein [Opitutales bacterium]|nr:RNA-binding protein [Opitutales bacterium]
MDNKLFVGNLSWETTGDDLKNYFSQFGTVESAEVMFDKFNGRSRGFGFVVMSSTEEAAEAVKRTHNVDFMGRALVVNVARPKTEEPSPRRRSFRGGYGHSRFGGDFGGHREFASKDGAYGEENRGFGGRSRFGGFRRRDGGFSNAHGRGFGGRRSGGFRPGDQNNDE